MKTKNPEINSGFFVNGPVSRVLSYPRFHANEMVIYLARGSLRRSSDLTRPDADVFAAGASNSLVRTYLVLLRVEIGRLTLLRHSTIKTQVWLRRGKLLHSEPWYCEALPLLDY